MSYSSSHSGGSAASHMPTPSRPIVGPAARDTLSLSLITYLEKMPLPALVLKPVGWEAGKLSHETVVYVNPALTSLSKSAVGLPSLDVEGKPLADLLRVDNPKDMEDWLSFAVQSGASSTKYTTGLVWSTPSTSATAVGVRPETLDIEWSAVQLEDTFVVLTGTVLSGRSPSPPAKPMPRRELSADGAFQQSSPALQTSDSWMRIERLSESLVGGGITGELLRNHDWSNTPLGPITSWPQSLVTTLSLVMGSQSPMAIWWGPAYVLLYNDAYIPVAGGKHPWLFGKPGPEGWKEIWHNLKPQADICMTGTGTYYDRDLLFMTRKGYPEEGYFNWSYIPIRQEDGSVGGLLNPNFEQSAEVLLERRMKTLRDFSVNAGQAKTMTQLLSIAAEVLTANTRDIAFALLYTGAVDHGEHQEGDGSDSHYYTLTLAETVGISRGHRAAAEQVTIDIDGDFANPAHLWPFQEACRQRGPKETHGQNIVEGIDGRCWGDPSKIVVTCPIIGSDAEEVRGVLVIGVSARRPYDEDYKTFIELLYRQTAASMATVLAYEEEVKRAEALAAIDRAKTAFFSSVSHELRTPLTLILGPLEELISDRLSVPTAIQAQRLNLINRNAKRLLKLVNSLLDFSRLEAGRMQASFRETDVAVFTRDLASVFRSAIEKGGVEFIVDCAEHQKPAFVDRDMWEKIVFNLIGNAFKFTLKGRIKVIVRPSADKTGLQFLVEDSGSGIPEAEIGRVFERFHRVEGQTGRSHEGSGIGLALTEELVKLHGGHVGVTSVLGQGSTFSVVVPYGSSHLPPDMVSADTVEVMTLDVGPRAYGNTVIEEAKHWLSGSSEDDSTESGSIAESSDSSGFTAGRNLPMTTRGCKILLADDNADMRKYVKMFLSTWWTVIEAADGQQALDMILASPPDIVVSDVMMPKLDGFGLLKALRSSPATRTLPFILLSARAGEEARVDGLRMGADDYLVKPFSAKELVARVHSHLEMSRLRVELEQRVKERTKELAESEWRYKALATMSPVGIYKTNKLGHLTFANDKWWEISMHNRRRDPSGISFLESVHPDDRERVQDEWRQALSTSPWSSEYRWHNKKTGVTHSALNETILEQDEQGNIVGLIGTLTDLTERKRLEKERLEALEMAEKYQRRRAEEAESVRRQQELFIDMTCHELRNPLNGIYHNADLIHESLEKVQTEVNTLKRAMATYPPESNCRAPPNMAGLLTQINSDLVQSIEAVETINQCAQHQKNIADDVLQVSKISMNLLRLSHVDYQPRQEIQNVVRMFETEAQAKSIALMLNVTPGYENLNVDWVRGDPKRLAQIMINLLSNAVRFTERMNVRAVTITVDAFMSPPFVPQRNTQDGSSSRSGSVVGSDDGETDKKSEHWGRSQSPSLSSSNSDQQLFGLKNHRSGSASSHTMTSSQETRKSIPGPPVFIQVTISDSGIGMTEEEQSLIFRRFSASPKTYGEFGGSGLGLFISKRLVELQGGQIGVESNGGPGTTFKFYVKCEMRNSPATDGLLHPPEKPSLRGGSLSDSASNASSRMSISKLARRRSSHTDVPSQMPNFPPVIEEPAQEEVKLGLIHVLIVEDNLVNQKVLKRQLEMAGFTCEIANHGGEALALLQQQPEPPSPPAPTFDIVLMDIEMPVMDGLTCSGHIRTGEAQFPRIDSTSTMHIPIIAVTGNARQEYLQKAMEVGMDEFIVKPYVKKDLVAKIETLVKKRRGL